MGLRPLGGGNPIEWMGPLGGTLWVCMGPHRAVWDPIGLGGMPWVCGTPWGGCGTPRWDPMGA